MAQAEIRGLDMEGQSSRSPCRGDGCLFCQQSIGSLETFPFTAIFGSLRPFSLLKALNGGGYVMLCIGHGDTRYLPAVEMIWQSPSFLHGRVRVSFRTGLLAQQKTTQSPSIGWMTGYQPSGPASRRNTDQGDASSSDRLTGDPMPPLSVHDIRP
jgi:hypothetical protein